VTGGSLQPGDHIERKIVVAVVVAAILYVALCVGIRFSYRLFVYSPPPSRVPIPTGAEALRLRATDGVPVRALWFPPAPGQRVIAYFHGGGGSIDDDVPLAVMLVQHHFGVLLVEYRGYGHPAEGTPSEAGLYADAEAALDEAARRGVGPERIALWGYSLGSGVAAEMAYRGHGAALVLISPFTSVVDVATHAAPWLPMSLLFPDRYDTVAKAPSIRVPTLVVHGDRDPEIPFDEGRAVAAAIPGARFLPVVGAGHEDIFDLGGTTLFDAAFDVSRR
jgi:pimeloyl-ACP methyl ester carboxylesterase